MQYPPPYGPPPKKQGSGLVLIALFGGLGLLMMLALVAGGVAAFLRADHGTSAGHGPSAKAAASLRETYALKNGLVVLHYPSDFAAKSLDDSTAILSRHLSDGTDELVQVGAVGNPISDEVAEFSRVLLVAMIKKIEAAGDTWTETSRKTGPCFQGHSGLLVEGAFVAKKRTTEHVRVCFFMDQNHGYELKTVVPAAHEDEELPLLQAIVDASELR